MNVVIGSNPGILPPATGFVSTESPGVNQRGFLLECGAWETLGRSRARVPPVSPREAAAGTWIGAVTGEAGG